MKGKKIGGRVKGTPNKKTQDLLELCESKGINVFEAMLELAIDPMAKPQEKFDRLAKLAPYLYSQRKALEVSNADDKGFLVVIKDYSEKK